VRSWVVAAGLIEGPDGYLLVQNRRRNGSLDWSPPGGVIEVADGETIRDGLSREVAEETGLVVTQWEGPVYEVEVIAHGLGWCLHVETYRAQSYSGDLRVDDPDGIVVDARFVALHDTIAHLEGAHQWVREPVMACLLTPAEVTAAAAAVNRFCYRVDGDPEQYVVVRLPEGVDG
jgi:ADP-ribose pyrophosphatase YjhB (NUDIX family)